MSCEKIPYKTEEAAVAALEILQRKTDSRRREASHYKCPRCLYWHLTSRRPATVDDFEDLTK